MIIIDLQQIMIANLLASYDFKSKLEVNADLLRHMILNSIRYNKLKFRNDGYGQFVLACDSGNSWRKDIFPYYKAGRKVHRDKIKIDWNSVFSCFSEIKEDLVKYFPYTVLEIPRVEADDIIAMLVSEIKDESHLILSGDKDFIQLSSKSVKQYDPIRKKYIGHQNPDQFLKEHIIIGDRSDGIPNILSPDNTFVDNIRQKPLTKQRIQYYMDIDPRGLVDINIKKNYERNEVLIDLKQIPKPIKTSITEKYNNYKPAKPDFINYFMKNKMRNLIEYAHDF